MSEATETAILGGGLAGLSAGCILTRAGRSAVVVEAAPEVGGLARTIEHRGFRFDLGGHRFLTSDEDALLFVTSLLRDDLLEVPRSSKIYLQGRYFDYPLRPVNALSGLGLPATLRILTDYATERFKSLVPGRSAVSLEDWVVKRFGRRMYDLYFRDYSEKVWGIAGSRISAEWVGRRIAGLSLGKAVKNAFFRRSGQGIATLADRFLYPRRGIGQLSERLRDEITARNSVRTGTRVLRVRREKDRITGVMVRSGEQVSDIRAREYCSSIPLTSLVGLLHPAPPDAVLSAAAGLRFRDLVVATVMLDRPRVTDLSWLYLPDKDMPIGRVHEPKNWSASLAPPGKTHLVAEYFCSRGDAVWAATDAELADLTVQRLSGLGFFHPREVIGSCVVRVPRAYPVLDIEYRQRHDLIMDYLGEFSNLQVIGRGGTFQYLNMDHAVVSGIRAAVAVLERTMTGDAAAAGSEALPLPERVAALRP